MSDFDITKHEWSDTSIWDCHAGADEVQLENPELETNFEKLDAIALAKHFKLTAEDLS